MSRITVVYLGGFGRSGSTLVERMLGAAHGWVNVGELVDPARTVGRSTSSADAGSASLSAPCGRRSVKSPSAGGPRTSWSGWPGSNVPLHVNVTCRACSAHHAARPTR